MASASQRCLRWIHGRSSGLSSRTFVMLEEWKVWLQWTSELLMPPAPAYRKSENLAITLYINIVQLEDD